MYFKDSVVMCFIKKTAKRRFIVATLARLFATLIPRSSGPPAGVRSLPFATELCSAESHTGRTQKTPKPAFYSGDPSEIRTRVTAVKGRCPRPLDDRVKKANILIPFFTLFCKCFFCFFDFILLCVDFMEIFCVKIKSF